MKKYSFVLLIYILAATQAGQAQVQALSDSSRVQAGRDSVAADTSAKKIFKVRIWKYHAPLHSRLVSTDSTMRWNIWPDWVDKKNRDPGIITYRLGNFGRSNTMMAYAHGPSYQELNWEGITMNDPVSGTIHWDFIPHHKIERLFEEDQGIRYTTHYYLKQYYLTKPLTQLNYEESKYSYRGLEFLLSQNLSQKTNAEISYWDRRHDGEYRNADVSGHQIFARIFHQLDHRQALKIHFLNNKYTAGQPFGYAIPDMANFNFDRFATTPKQPGAKSDIAATNLALSYYRRSEDTTKVTDNLHAGLFLNSNRRELKYSSDSTYYKIQALGGYARKWLDLGALRLEGGLSYALYSLKDNSRSSLQHGSWQLLKGDAKASYNLLGLMKLNGQTAYRKRSDGFSSYLVEAGAELNFWNRILLTASASKGTVMPTPQQLYWLSDDYAGNPALKNAQITEGHGKLSARLGKPLEVGVRAQLKRFQRGIQGTPDSTFSNTTPYESLSLVPYFELNTPSFELSGSVAYQQFGHFLDNSSDPLPVDGHKRVWLKGGAYVKGYLFKRATYVKAGLSGMISPFIYRAAHYNPVLDHWQVINDDPFLPSFNRLDLDISARVRTIMVVLRWENILDDVSQLGYFETAQYPMQGRRFIFGIRVLFHN